MYSSLSCVLYSLHQTKAPCTLSDVTKTPALTLRGLIAFTITELVIFTLSSCFRFLLALYRGLLIMLSLANLLLDTCLCTVSLESA